VSLQPYEISTLPDITKNGAKRGRPVTAVRSIEPIVLDFHRKPFSVPFISFTPS